MDALVGLVAPATRVVILTGAGCSTGSGIPDYRDRDGEWKRTPPIRYQRFVESELSRKRYWARSMVGWNLVEGAKPSEAHRSLAALEAMGRTSLLITQNVDGLHQKAGHRAVNDLHGRIDRIRCLGCQDTSARVAFQERLAALNPGFRDRRASYAPDGDADLDGIDFDAFDVPACELCGGMLKPDVVFFGESVPADRVDHAMAAVDAADVLLTVGTSLMVWSGYRFVKRAAKTGIPVAAINFGRTRADEELDLKVDAECGAVVSGLVEALRIRAPEAGPALGS